MATGPVPSIDPRPQTGLSGNLEPDPNNSTRTITNPNGSPNPTRFKVSYCASPKPNPQSIERSRERDEAAARDGVLVEPEPEHGGALAAQAAGLRRLLLRHGSPRQAPGAFAPGAQCLRVRHPLQAHVRRPPPQGP